MAAATLIKLSTAQTTTKAPRRFLGSVGAVLAGFAVIGVVSTTDALLRSAGVFPADGKQLSDALFALATLYRGVYGIAGTTLAARLAPSKPLQHALVLGAIGVVVSTLGAIAIWHVGAHWYAIANILIALPAAFIGGRLGSARRETRS